MAPKFIRSSNPLEINVNRVIKAVIRRTLNEDLRQRGDITTRATIPPDQHDSAMIIAKSDGIVAGQSVAAAVFHALDKSVKYSALIPDGKFVNPRTEIAQIHGKTWAILSGERTALNLLGRCSGIATLTNQFVNIISGTSARITDTRKTAPGLRTLDKASVIAGGGVNHRIGLFDQFLIKENHIAAAGGISQAIRACYAFREKWGKFKLTVEVRNFDEYLIALAEHPDRILLDNMTPDEIRHCVNHPHHPIELEVSGGINLDTVRQYAETGVDFISIGALTHSVKVLDLSLLIVNRGEDKKED